MEHTTATPPLHVCTFGGLGTSRQAYVPSRTALVTFKSNKQRDVYQAENIKVKLIVKISNTSH